VRIVLLTPYEETDEIADHIRYFPGSIAVQPGPLQNVFERYEMMMKWVRPTYLMRITADCPSWSALLAERLLNEMQIHHADFGWIKTPEPFQDGLDVEIIENKLWQRMASGPKHVGIEEHVTIGLKGEFGVCPVKTLVLPKDAAYDLPFKISIDEKHELDEFKKRKNEIWWTPVLPNLKTDSEK
jgi:spore coat polysaccharide biosynthesis protein SpsF